jgi:hypothetical protein
VRLLQQETIYTMLVKEIYPIVCNCFARKEDKSIEGVKDGKEYYVCGVK